MKIRLKYSAGPNVRLKSARGHADEDQRDSSDRPAHKRTDGRHPQGRPRPSLSGHLIAIQARHHGGAFTRDIKEDRCGRPSVLGPVDDRGEHDQGGDRVHPEREGKKNRDGGRWAEAGEYPHDRPQKAADHRHHEIERGQYQGKTMPQTAQGIHGLSSR